MTEAELGPSHDLCAVVLGSPKAVLETAAPLEKVWLQRQAGWRRFRVIRTSFALLSLGKKNPDWAEKACPSCPSTVGR